MSPEPSLIFLVSRTGCYGGENVNSQISITERFFSKSLASWFWFAHAPISMFLSSITLRDFRVGPSSVGCEHRELRLQSFPLNPSSVSVEEPVFRRVHPINMNSPIQWLYWIWEQTNKRKVSNLSKKTQGHWIALFIWVGISTPRAVKDPTTTD